MISVVLGLVTLHLLGEGCYRWLRRAGWMDSEAGSPLGLRLLLATASVPWVVLLFDLAGIPITRWSVGLAAVVVAGSAVAVDWWRGRGRGRDAVSDDGAGSGEGRKSGPGPANGGGKPRGIDGAFWGPASVRPWMAGIGAAFSRAPAASVLTLLVAALVLFSVIHTCLVPERNYDALVGYDLVGKIMAREGVYRSSVFTKINFNAQCVYPPFTAANNGFWYLYHPEGWKLWVPISVAGFLLVFAGLIRRWTGSPTAAGLASFLMFLPTAFLFQLTAAQTDMPSTIFTALAVLCVVDGLARRGGFPRGRYAWITLLLLIATTGRSENVLFGMGLGAALLAWGGKGKAKAVLFFVVPAAFFAFWNLFYVRQMLGYDPGAHFVERIDFDPARMGEVVRLAVAIITDSRGFGEFGWMIVALPVLWFAGQLPVVRERLGMERTADFTGTLLSLCVILFLFYLPFFYLWDPELNPLWTMEHTFKRGFFRFIPLLMAAFVCAPPVLWVLRRGEGERC